MIWSTNREGHMDRDDKILWMLGRIEGELIEIRKLSERLSKVEMWLSWLKGGWAALLAAYAYIWDRICRRGF